ncbi:amidohydrolase family protein [Salipiger bermudensis]|uniref:metal-dependent hydrolase family protein n=1 Tax=Salipiger bermudensis TaxID=344736 RepID=UPI001C99447D|nr:amidohydrolase family protein [Salipiger bermudensis]MBY6006685.1 amidohydrolase family protein [Salipiger bermudensis]
MRIYPKATSLFAATCVCLAGATQTQAQEVTPPQVLFTNCNIFDGIAESLAEGRNVLVEGNLIASVGDASLAAEGAEVVDCDERTLMPGLIDAHSHLYMNMDGGVAGMERASWEEIGSRSVHMAVEYLLNGITSVRDMGGGGSGLKKTVDAGLVAGPRIYPSGAYISQTSGHGDFRNGSQRNPNLPPFANDNNLQRLGITIIADGVDQVIAAVRQNLSQGSSQLKLMAGGGVSSTLDPLHTMQFFPEEIEAAVRAAADWDTYVGVHVFSDEGIRRSVDAGVKSIEHGFFASRDTMQLMKDNGVFLVSQMTGISPYLQQLPALQAEPNRSKLLNAQAQSQDYVENVKAIRPPMAFATDVVFTTAEAMRGQIDYEKWFHADLFGNHAMLVSATSAAGELLAYSGQANPYPGKLGVIEEGAYADILVVDGNPLEDITVIGGNAQWYDAEPRGPNIPTLPIIMKDGRIYKNTLSDWTPEYLQKPDPSTLRTSETY